MAKKLIWGVIPSPNKLTETKHLPVGKNGAVVPVEVPTEAVNALLHALPPSFTWKSFPTPVISHKDSLSRREGGLSDALASKGYTVVSVAAAA